MRRLPTVVFLVLAAATAGAFFFVQHLKVTTPLIAGASAPNPAAINPITRPVCGHVNHGATTVTFYLLHRADDVAVYVTDQNGNIVATLASGRHMRTKVRFPDGVFTWDGREDNGRPAPDGTYFVQVDLIHQGRNFVLSPPSGGTPFAIKVETHGPRPRVLSVRPQRIPVGRSLPTTIRYTGTEGHSATVRLYRTDGPGRPRLVKSFLISAKTDTAKWDGLIHGRPAPQGVYLVGLEVTDAACNTARYPSRMPPAPGSTPGAGLTVHYVAATPPAAPVPAGSRVALGVDTGGTGFRFALRRAGSSATVASGGASAAPPGTALHVQMPPRKGGLYELTVRAGSHRTTVPLVAASPRRAPVLVVLPSLTWVGLSPVDDSGDGLPDTLASGASVPLARPLPEGLPAGYADEAALIDYLTSTHRPYELTTDVGLIEGRGPSLAGHRGVILDGGEQWITPALGRALRAYVQSGGQLLSVGSASLRAYVTVAGGSARAPRPLSSIDVFGVHYGPLVAHPAVMTVVGDPMGLFSETATPLPAPLGYDSIVGVPPPADLLSSAGPTPESLGIVGFTFAQGDGYEISVTGFGRELGKSAAARSVFDAIWTRLTE